MKAKNQTILSECSESMSEDEEPPSNGSHLVVNPSLIFSQNGFSYASPPRKNNLRINYPAKPPRGGNQGKSSVLRLSSQDKISISQTTREFRDKFFSAVSDKEWSSWQWQLRNSYLRMGQLEHIINLSEREVLSLNGKTDSLPIRITPYYASLLISGGDSNPIRRSVVPVIDEQTVSLGECSDPLGEQEDAAIPNLVHRYPDRVLFLVTTFCATYCRYCTRSHIVAKENQCHKGISAWEAAIQYIQKHSQIRDVLISGGDALTLPDSQIDYLLKRLRDIPHVEIIRIGTKVPAVLPQRITKALIGILRKYHPLYMSLHFTHPDELTPEVSQAVERLVSAGIPLGSQTVLLKGINDDVDTMKALMQGLLRIRVRPYYLYQCDPILGSAHFRTSVDKGLEIIRGLRGHTSGYAVPHYVIDAPGGGGKIPLLPDYFQGYENNDILLRNYAGQIYRYPDYASLN